MPRTSNRMLPTTFSTTEDAEDREEMLYSFKVELRVLRVLRGDEVEY
jgi:hypothetical protein